MPCERSNMREGDDVSDTAASGPDQTAAPEIEITLVVPVYEEEYNIVSFVREVNATVTLPHRIAIVYDHDNDSTLRKRDEVLAIDSTIAFIRNTAGHGVINAFVTGFNVAQTRYVVPI